MTVASKSKISLAPKHLGYARLGDNPPECIELVNPLLQKNHDNFHMFWRDVAGHNHTVHSVLSVFALGGGVDDLKRAYDDDDLHQEPMPPVDPAHVAQLHDPSFFLSHMGQLQQYGNYLRFFEQQLDIKSWQQVIGDYCFSGTKVAEAMFVQLNEGAFHPIIHLGFGVEFAQPTIIAEALAHIASHDPANIDVFFRRCEQAAKSGNVPPKPLAQLFKELRANDVARSAARMQEGPVRVREGVMGRAMDELVALASQHQISTDDLERSMAENISCSAYLAGAPQRRGKAAKIDFFYMHDVTSSLFLTVLVRQSWISDRIKARLIEWKGRMDLVWYAASGAPELRPDAIEAYEPTASQGMDWTQLYAAVVKVNDDGHVAKFVRALKNGQTVSKSFEAAADCVHFPVQGDMWFRLAQMAYDTTVDLPDSAKWIMGAGFDPLWAKIADVK